MTPAIPFESLVDPVGQPEQRELPERGQVALAEIVRQGGVDPVGRVNVAVGETAA